MWPESETKEPQQAEKLMDHRMVLELFMQTKASMPTLFNANLDRRWKPLADL